MTERRSERFETNLHAVIICNGRRYRGNIRNISEEGVGCVISDFINETNGFAAGRLVNLILLTPSKDTLSLNCEIRWLSVTSSASQKNFMGAKIISPSGMYKRFFDASLVANIH
jgi:hypothetical protein